MTKIRDHFRNLSNKLLADAAVAGVTKHASTTGALREKIIRDFLRPHLPRSFEIRSGIIIDSEKMDSIVVSQISNQQDCIIVDTRMPIISVGSDTEALIIAESVIGVVEVKSFLDKNELMGILTKTVRTKSLVRHGIQEYKKGNAHILFKPHPIATYVIAFDGTSPNKLSEHIESFANGKVDGQEHSINQLPNAICILNQGVLLTDSTIPVVNNDEVIMPPLKNPKLRVRNYSKDALFVFYQRLHSDATYTRIQNFDLDVYYSNESLE